MMQNVGCLQGGIHINNQPKMSVLVQMPVAGKRSTSRAVRVSAEDEKNVRSHDWWISINQNQNDRQYVKGVVHGKLTLLSHLIIGKPPTGHVVDHLDGNTLNNTRENLRWATFRQNAQNRVPKPNKSGYLGVCTKGPKWSARCNNLYLGTFSTPVDAARHYDSYVVHEYGPHAKRNFPDEMVQEYIPAAKKAKTSGIPTGVYQIRTSQKFMVYAKSKHLGTFDNKEEAGAVYESYIRQEQEQLHRNLQAIPIDYDKDGHAVLPVRKAGEVVLFMKVDPEDWHEYLSGGLNLSPDGFVQTRKNGVTVLVHRHVTKAPPLSIVDHINRIRTDCRKENLRFVTAAENFRNRKRKASSWCRF